MFGTKSNPFLSFDSSLKSLHKACSLSVCKDVSVCHHCAMVGIVVIIWRWVWFLLP